MVMFLRGETGRWGKPHLEGWLPETLRSAMDISCYTNTDLPITVYWRLHNRVVIYYTFVFGSVCKKYHKGEVCACVSYFNV